MCVSLIKYNSHWIAWIFPSGTNLGAKFLTFLLEFLLCYILIKKAVDITYLHP